MDLLQIAIILLALVVAAAHIEAYKCSKLIEITRRDIRSLSNCIDYIIEEVENIKKGKNEK